MMDLVGGYIIDLILGDPQGFPHPVRLIGRGINFLEKRLLDREGRKKALLIRGALMTLMIVVLALGATTMIVRIGENLHPILGKVISLYLAYTVLATKSLDKETRKVYKRLMKGDIEGARIDLSYIVSRDTVELNEAEIVRATVETIAENISDGIVAPLFYLSLGGVPLAMAYKAINTLDSMVGYKSDRYLYFGRASAKLDDLANYIPARLTALLIGIAGLFRGKNIISIYKMALRDGRNHTSPNAGYPEAAMAGTLSIQLGGVNRYFGQEVYKPTIGEAIIPLKREHIIETIRLMYLTSLTALAFFVLLQYSMGVG